MADDCGGGTAATVHHEVLHALGGIEKIYFTSDLSVNRNFQSNDEILPKALLMSTIDPIVILI